MTFEEWFSDLQTDERWLEMIQMAPDRKNKDLRACAMEVYGEYVADGTISNRSSSESKRHIWYKLPKMPDKVVSNIRKSSEEYVQSFHKNPLDDQAKKRVDDLLSDFLKDLKEVTRPVPQLTKEEIEENGQVRPKSFKHPSTPLSLVKEKERHDRWIKANYDIYTGKPLPTWKPEDEWNEGIDG